MTIDVRKWLEEQVLVSVDYVNRGISTTPLEKMQRPGVFEAKGTLTVEFFDPNVILQAIGESAKELQKAAIREELAADMRRAGFDPETGAKVMVPLRVKGWIPEDCWPEFVVFSAFVDQRHYIPAKKAPR